MLVRKQSGTNTVEVVDRVQAAAEQDRSDAAARSESPLRYRPVDLHPALVRGHQLHLILGGLLASLVVFLFIRNLRVTFIAALAIPTSIIGTFTVMKAFGFTLNNMTMLALSLATGIVIDDAIVVLENIFRYVEEKGLTPKEAAADATREIGLAVMATTLSLVVIFVPVAFMTGQIGRYFYSFGLTAAAAILHFDVRLLHADTGALRLVDEARGHEGGPLQRRSRPASTQDWTRSTDGCSAGRSTTVRAMMGIAGAVTISAAFLYPYVGKELVPDDDQGEFNINVRLPRGTSYPRTEEFIAPIEKEVLALPSLYRVSTSVNPGSASFHSPHDRRSKSDRFRSRI